MECGRLNSDTNAIVRTDVSTGRGDGATGEGGRPTNNTAKGNITMSAHAHGHSTHFTTHSHARTLLAASSAGIWVLAGSAALAADADSKDPAPLETVFVTAQKREQNLQEVPISITVMSGAELDKSSFAGVTEALNRVPGVATTVGNQGGGTQLTVRGVGANGPLFAGSSPIAYYLDSAPFGLVRTSVAPDANAYDLKRVEVLRGPQGTLYGASAQNGVVQVLTNDPNLSEFELKARTTVSTTERGGENYRGDVALNVPIVEGKLGARAVVGYQDFSGWIDRANQRDANDSEVRNLRLKVEGRPTDALTVGFSAWMSRADAGAPSASDDNGFAIGTLPQFIETDYDIYGLKIDYDAGSFSISSRTSYLEYENAGDLDLTPTNFPVVLLTAFDANMFSQEILLNSTIDSPWRWTAGLYYRDAEDSTFQTIAAIPVTLAWTDTSEAAAAFGEVSRRFANDKLEWTLGLRYFRDEVVSRQDPAGAAPGATLYNEKDSFHSTTPRAVLTWFPSKSLTVYGSYSEGFRSGAPQTYFVAVPGFPPVKPDKLHNYEVGAKADLFEKLLTVDMALYYIDWQDVQQQLAVPYQNVDVTALTNGESASGIGADLGLTLRPANGVSLGVSASWNDLAVDSPIYIGSSNVVLFDKGSRLNYSPELTVGAFADCSFPVGSGGYEAQLSLSGYYTSDQTFHGFGGNTAFENPGDSVTMTRVSISLLSPKHWTAALFVDNANDEDAGMPAVSGYSPRLRPRTIGLQVDYQF
jgi:iron complex outermembrane recepter protein